MDIEMIATIVTAILGVAGASWGGYAAAKGRLKKKLKQAVDFITTAKDALDDDKLSKEEIKVLMDKAKALITFEKEKTDA